MLFGIEITKTGVQIFFFIALNLLIMHRVIRQNKFTSLVLATGCSWMIVPIRILLPSSPIEATLISVWNAFLLWPTYTVLALYTIYVIATRYGLSDGTIWTPALLRAEWPSRKNQQD